MNQGSKYLPQSETPTASITARVVMNPTRTQALSELPHYPIVHFTCHGYSADDPSQSSLLLEDWKTTPLTASDLTSLNINYAKFAFLSSCHSSTGRNFRLLDESINLSLAIQLAGYLSIVGTLWEVDESNAAEVGREVYAWILNRSGEVDVQTSAETLHKAVHALRDRTRVGEKNNPLTWAPYIHVGI
jgi:CHAT domain-containing protein